MLTHQPVLLDTVLDHLAIQPSGIYVDATFGRGGHTEAILGRLNAEGRVIALDRDPEAVAYGQVMSTRDKRLTMVQARFSQLKQILDIFCPDQPIHGCLFDLGVSSPQLDQAERGFSFQKEGPLDMRMDPSQGQSLADCLKTVSERELAHILYTYGQERHSRKIAQAILQRQKRHALSTTTELAELISARYPRSGKCHPATRTFQALRIHVNQELSELESALPQAWDALAVKGRLVLMAFHSLEDRINKCFMQARAKEGSMTFLAGRFQHASLQEKQRNPRARSAVLRAGERIQ